jgi:SAM-dependent methyltransferase
MSAESDREALSSEGKERKPDVPGFADSRRVAADYDRVADEYTRHIFGELAGKPFDRALLDRFAAEVGMGRVCDVGCGPGHVSAYLHARGCDVFGVDLSTRMVELASTLNPGVEFRVGDLRALPAAARSLAGAVCLYSLIHLAADELAPALAALHRTLRPGGQLLLAVHEGQESRAPGQMWGIPVSLRFNFFTRAEITAALAEAGLTIRELTSRPPYAGVEVETNRLYAWATSPRPDSPAGNGEGAVGAL